MDRRSLRRRRPEPREVVVERGYENVNQWTTPVDEAAAVRYLVDNSGLDPADADDLRSVRDAPTLITATKALESSVRKEAFLDQLAELVGEGSVGDAVQRYLATQLPTFVYYANYYTLPGQMSLDHFIEVEAQQDLKWPEKIFKALLSLVGSTAQDINEKDTYEAMKADLEAIGLRLSNEIFEYWSQNSDLSVDFNFDKARRGRPAALQQRLRVPDQDQEPSPRRQRELRRTQHGIRVVLLVPGVVLADAARARREPRAAARRARPQPARDGPGRPAALHRGEARPRSTR